jgi:peptide/nickel transport system ATP-binding protein
MRQRVVIALALAAEPKLIVADEPTTALDVSIQAQIISCSSASAKRGAAVMLITHDMGVIAETCDRVAVMYAGRIAEIGPVHDVINQPAHPYTAGLMASIPDMEQDRERLNQIDGAMPRLNAIPRAAPSTRAARLSTAAAERPDLMAPAPPAPPAGCTPPTRWPHERAVNRPGAGARPGQDLRRLRPLAQPRARAQAAPLLHAVDGVSFEIEKGKTLALVGESGCGKSTVARLLVGLYEPRAGPHFRRAGRARRLQGRQRQGLRRRIQMIFQDPYASLNPRWKVEDIIGEPLREHGLITDKAQLKQRVGELLQSVGLSPLDMAKYPHQFSGGQRQRISIARALATEPEFLVCDEPTSALDVSVQAQVLNIMKDLQRERQLTYLFISHNLAVVRHVSDQVGVMYLGRLVELADKHTLFDTPRHPYTRMLLDAIPKMHDTGRARPRAGRGAQPAQPATGLRLQPALPACQRPLPHRAAQAAQHGRHPHCLPRGGRRAHLRGRENAHPVRFLISIATSAHACG